MLPNSHFYAWFTNSKLRPGLFGSEPVSFSGRFMGSVQMQPLGSIRALSLASHLLLLENGFTGTF